MAETSKGKLSMASRLSYSVGHVLNDLCASMWFSYLLVYLHQVINFNNKLAGDLMMIGQVSDALCTPFVGFESDKTKGILKMGKRKTWHFVGSLCVIVSFPFLFNQCITCAHSPDWAQFIYFAPFVVIFQFGWASTQISHLSLIPDLTDDENERVGLNGWRYAFTVLSNLTVYAVAWLLFAVGSGKGHDKSDLGIEDAPVFRNLAFIVIGTGIIFTFIFHVGVKEKPAQDVIDPEIMGRNKSLLSCTTSMENGSLKLYKSTMCVTDWFKEHQFYQIGLIYMFTRLYVNLSQVYLPMYLIETLKLDKTTIAIVPLVVYISGFVTSMIMKPLNKVVGRKLTYTIGAVFGVASCAWVFFINSSDAKQVYGAAIFLGIGGSAMQVTSLAMTADLIAQNTESGAFVYGAMSFTDKLANGVGIVIIQQFHPCLNCCPACVPYYHYVQSCVPGGCVVLAMVILITLVPQTIGQRRKFRGRESKYQAEISVPNGGTHLGYNSITEREPLLRKNGNTPPLDVGVRTSTNTPPKDVGTHTSSRTSSPRTAHSVNEC